MASGKLQRENKALFDNSNIDSVTFGNGFDTTSSTRLFQIDIVPNGYQSTILSQYVQLEVSFQTNGIFLSGEKSDGTWVTLKSFT